jgi:S-adenosylmethionine:tRNA ribosyltransferase-isomerase
MHISDFDYELPPELIAREPVRPRDASRMLVLNRETGSWIDSDFRKLPDFLRPSDVIVFNDTRVMRARVLGELERSNGSTREIEVLFSGLAGRAGSATSTWEVMCRPGKRIRKGDRVVFGKGAVVGEFVGSSEHGLRLLRLNLASANSLEDFLNAHGRVPLPPYLQREETPTDAVEYQTIFAASPGAVAAPTAGLHFTTSVLDALRDRGIETMKITLHVGIGTFMPVRTEDPRQHSLKPERFQITPGMAARLNAARDEGRRIVAVGTTTTRTLEYIVHRYGRFEPASGEADLFILPGYEFKAVGALVTNFHLPRSTLIMLVSAFTSRTQILAAYRHAIQERYRFYSYGDCMLIE